MASLSDYLRGDSLPGPDAAELDKLIKSLKTDRKNRKVGEALGVDTDTSPTPGLVTFLFDPQEGVVSSAGRGIRAGLFDIMGVNNPELQIRNPIESAVDAFKGEFNIGTGDVIKVKPDDSLLTRAAKLGAAFTGDVVTDPVSYVGGAGVLGRAAASRIAIQKGDDILKAAGKAGVDEDGLITKLIERTPAGKTAAEQKRLIDAGEVTREELGDASLVDLLGDGVKRRDIAGRELGNIVGSALLARGRAGVIDDLTEILGNRSAATKVFESLPDEVRGGLFLVNPLTGSPKVRLSSGTGAALGPVGRAGNQLRFDASRTLGKPITNQFSGRTGPVLQAAKQAIKDSGRKAPTDMASTRLSDWVAYSDGLRARGADFSRISAPWMSAVGLAYRTQKDSSPEAQEAFRRAFFQPWQAQDVSRPEIAAAVEQADNLRKVMRSAWQARKDVGLDIGDLGDQWSPLRVTKEEAEKLKAASRTNSFDDAYRTERGRNSLVQPVLDAEQGQRGFRVPGRGDVEFADAITANEILGRNAYSTDPIQVATEYLHEAANAVATQKFVNAMADSGVLIRDIPESVFALRGVAAARLQRVATQAGQVAARKAAEAEAAAQGNLEATVERGAAYQDQFLRLRGEAQERWMMATDDVAVAEREVEDALATLRRVEPRAQIVRDRLRTYARTGLEDSVSDSERLTRNAAARTATANQRTVEAAENVARINRETEDFPLGDYERTVGPAQEAAADAFDRLDDAAQELARLREEVAILRSNRDGILDDLSTKQAQEARAYATAKEGVLAAKERLAEARRVLRGSKRDLDQVTDLPAVQALTAVDGVVSAYTTRMYAAKGDLEKARGALNSLRRNQKSLKDRIRKGRRDGADVAPLERQLTQVRQQIKAQVAEVRRIDGEVAQSREAIEKAIAGGLKLDGPAKDYAEAVIVAANKLSEIQFQAMKVVASETRVREAMEAIAQAGDDPAVVSAAIADLVENYRIVRSALGRSDFQKFEKADRKILRQIGKVGDVTVEKVQQGATGRFAASQGMRAGGGKFRDLYGTHSMQESLERMFMAANSKSEAQRILQDYISPYTLLWRLSATQLRGPAYTLLNLTGAAYNNYLGGGSAKAAKVSIGATYKVVRAMRKAGKDTPGITAVEQFRDMREIARREIGDATWNGEKVTDLFDWIAEDGLFESTQTFEAIEEVSRLGGAAEAARLTRAGAARYAFADEPTSLVGRGSQATVNFALTNPVSRFINDTNATVEVAARFAAFLDGVKKFGSREAARDYMYMLHFDYQDLAPLEKWARVFVPFYTWSRRNIPLQIRSLFLQPSKVTKALYLMDAAEGSFGADGEDAWVQDVLPEYVQVAGGFATMFDFNGNQITFSSNLPFQDVNKVVQASAMPVRWREVANMVGPAAGLLGAMQGVNTATGARFDPAGTPAPAYLKAIDQLTPGELLNRDSQGRELAPEGLVNIINELLPTVGVVERAASGAGSLGVPLVGNLAPDTAQDRGRTNAINFLGLAAALGGYTSTLTPRTMRGELRRRSEAATAILEDAAARAGVDLQWVRDRIGEGLEPAEVAILIASGEGKLTEDDSKVRMDRAEGSELRDTLLDR